MTKYILTKGLKNILTQLHGEASGLMEIVIDIFNRAEIRDNDYDNIDITMTRLNDAWEKLKKTPKEGMRDNNDK